MKKILFDTNVILDWLLEREYFYKASTVCIMKCKDSAIEGYLTPHSISDVFYLVRKEKGVKAAKEFINLLANIFLILKEDEETIASIIESDAWKKDLWNDIEDAMQIISARNCRMDMILARNPKDFKESDVVFMTPEEFCNEGSC